MAHAQLVTYTLRNEWPTHTWSIILCGKHFLNTTGQLYYVDGIFTQLHDMRGMAHTHLTNWTLWEGYSHTNALYERDGSHATNTTLCGRGSHIQCTIYGMVNWPTALCARDSLTQLYYMRGIARTQLINCTLWEDSLTQLYYMWGWFTHNWSTTIYGRDNVTQLHYMRVMVHTQLINYTLWEG